MKKPIFVRRILFRQFLKELTVLQLISCCGRLLLWSILSKALLASRYEANYWQTWSIRAASLRQQSYSYLLLLLSVRRIQHPTVVDRTFPVAAADVGLWNSLQQHVTSKFSLPVFRIWHCLPWRYFSTLRACATTTTTTTTTKWITVMPSHSCWGTLQNLDIKLLHTAQCCAVIWTLWMCTFTLQQMFSWRRDRTPQSTMLTPVRLSHTDDIILIIIIIIRFVKRLRPWLQGRRRGGLRSSIVWHYNTTAAAIVCRWRSLAACEITWHCGRLAANVGRNWRITSVAYVLHYLVFGRHDWHAH